YQIVSAYCSFHPVWASRLTSTLHKTSFYRGKILPANNTLSEENGIFIEGDIVWIKVWNLYWPGIVTKVLKKCKKAVVKLVHTCKKKKAYTKPFKDLIDFRNTERNRKLLNTGKEENCKVEEAYKKAVDFFEKRNSDTSSITKKEETINNTFTIVVNTDGSQEMDEASSSRMANSDDDVNRIEELLEHFGKAASDNEDDDDKPGELNMADSAVKEDSPDGQKVIEEVKKLTCLRYLKSVFQGRSSSERHKIFMRGSWSDRNTLKFSSGVGPLDDKQVHMVYKILSGYLLKIAPKGTIDNPSSYIFDVLLPEAIIFALENIHGIRKQEAEKVFTEMTLCKWSLQKCSKKSNTI
ncbi:uncharacterized protein LOC126095422, partial [Schistocerca cancellata]|uniref:uncharacterized protein LOC126095422 n=1 Tax=Schistocerca cancellata TaxID=274614 RepID=UPI002119A9F7